MGESVYVCECTHDDAKEFDASRYTNKAALSTTSFQLGCCYPIRMSTVTTSTKVLLYLIVHEDLQPFPESTSWMDALRQKCLSFIVSACFTPILAIVITPYNYIF